MAFSEFPTGILVRVTALLATLALLAWLTSHTDWYVTMGLCASAAFTQAVILAQYSSRASREVARFLDAIAFDDTSANFSLLSRDKNYGELGAAMTRVLDRLRSGRAEREEQSQYLQSILAHIPVALISVDERNKVQLLNLAARRLFRSGCEDTAAFDRYGDTFAASIEKLAPGESTIVRMESPFGTLQLKAAATGVVLGGLRRRLITLQNIETELTAQELASWQTVIRVMAHEVMNSLTPISSLATTARARVGESLTQIDAASPIRPGLEDASEALDTLARRSGGLLNFVQNHRRLTRRMTAQTDIVPVQRVFARLQRLIAEELQTRDIKLVARVEPETLDISADIDLLDQALINLLRNAIEALRDTPQGNISLTASQDTGGSVVIAVADNGPGISADYREKVFVPFFTTKREGSGVGLTLVRQIASVHGGSVTISDTPGGGTTVNMKFKDS